MLHRTCHCTARLETHPVHIARGLQQHAIPNSEQCCLLAFQFGVSLEGKRLPAFCYKMSASLPRCNGGALH